MKILPITVEIANKYRKEIAQFYYDNTRSCAFLDAFTMECAYQKIGDFIEHLKDSTAISYGAFEEDGFYGFIWAYPHQFREEKRMYINEIRVKEEYRNRGIGSQLMKLVEERAKEMGLGAIYLHAEAVNTEAVSFYKSFGYKIERIQLRKEIRQVSQDND